MKRALRVACLAFLWFPLASCDDDDVDEAREEIEEAAEATGARAAAETMRGLLLRTDAEERRTLEALRDAADDVPGDPDITGIEDTTGDDLDDDGRVMVTVGDESACLTVAQDGETEVSSGEC